MAANPPADRLIQLYLSRDRAPPPGPFGRTAFAEEEVIDAEWEAPFPAVTE